MSSHLHFSLRQHCPLILFVHLFCRCNDLMMSPASRYLVHVFFPHKYPSGHRTEQLRWEGTSSDPLVQPLCPNRHFNPSEMASVLPLMMLFCSYPSHTTVSSTLSCSLQDGATVLSSPPCRKFSLPTALWSLIKFFRGWGEVGKVISSCWALGFMAGKGCSSAEGEGYQSREALSKWKLKLSDCLSSLLSFCSGIFNYYFSSDFFLCLLSQLHLKNVICRYKSRINHSWPSNMPPCVFILVLLSGQPWAKPCACFPPGPCVRCLLDLIFLWGRVCILFC